MRWRARFLRGAVPLAAPVPAFCGFFPYWRLESCSPVPMTVPFPGDTPALAGLGQLDCSSASGLGKGRRRRPGGFRFAGWGPAFLSGLQHGLIAAAFPRLGAWNMTCANNHRGR